MQNRFIIFMTDTFGVNIFSFSLYLNDAIEQHLIFLSIELNNVTPFFLFSFLFNTYNGIYDWVAFLYTFYKCAVALIP